MLLLFSVNICSWGNKLHIERSMCFQLVSTFRHNVFSHLSHPLAGTVSCLKSSSHADPGRSEGPAWTLVGRDLLVGRAGTSGSSSETFWWGSLHGGRDAEDASCAEHGWWGGTGALTCCSGPRGSKPLTSQPQGNPLNSAGPRDAALTLATSHMGFSKLPPFWRFLLPSFQILEWLLWNLNAWVQIPAPSYFSCVALGKWSFS